MIANRVSPIPWWSISFQHGEAQAAADAIRNRHVSQGPVVAEFERQLAQRLNVPYVVATTSGSTALLMAMWASGVGPGTEVIVPARTWVATGHAAVLLGAQVRLVDVDRRSLISVSDVERLITPRTRAIVGVHLNGRAADIGGLAAIGAKYGLTIIEDAAQALGSVGPLGHLGTVGDMGCFSLSVAKIISTGQGGFVTTHSPHRYEALVAMRTHGVEDVQRAKWVSPGFNFRFTDILASIGLVQLEGLDENLSRARAIEDQYLDGLGDCTHVRLIQRKGAEVGPYIEVLVTDRDSLAQYLHDQDIETRLFYPNLSAATYWAGQGEYPQADQFAKCGLWLPSGPALAEESIVRVIAAVRLWDADQEGDPGVYS